MAKVDVSGKGEGTSKRSTEESAGGSHRPAMQRNGKAKAQQRKAQQTGHFKRPAASLVRNDAGDVGASKIKAALRQTRRLLAKDKLSSDVRQEAERRLASLESDLARKESSEQERKNAERYHKIRFFERQKLTRQIRKIKRAIAEVPEKRRNKLEGELREKRVLLNYVLHYPTSVKYVALFPSSGESPLDKPAEGQMETEQSRRARQTHESAIAVRHRIERSMKDGVLSQEPEVELERRYAEGTGSTSVKRARLDMSEAQNTMSDGGDKKRQRSGRVGGSEDDEAGAASKATHSSGIVGDDFFAMESDDE